jgi:hypothetical protein
MSYIVAKQTAAISSENIDLTRGPFPKTITVAGLLVDEEIEIFVVDDEDDSVLALYDADGVAVVLTVTSQPLTVPGPIWLQFEKPETSNAVGVKITNITV